MLLLRNTKRRSSRCWCVRTKNLRHGYQPGVPYEHEIQPANVAIPRSVRRGHPHGRDDSKGRRFSSTVQEQFLELACAVWAACAVGDALSLLAADYWHIRRVTPRDVTLRLFIAQYAEQICLRPKALCSIYPNGQQLGSVHLHQARLTSALEVGAEPQGARRQRAGSMQWLSGRFCDFLVLRPYGDAS